MIAKSKNGQRTFELYAKDRKVLTNAMQFFDECSDLAAGYAVGALAEKALELTKLLVEQLHSTGESIETAPLGESSV